MISMGRVETANTLSLVGAILSTVIGTIYLLVGISVTVLYRGSNLFWILFVFPLVISLMIIGILSLIFGTLTSFIARKKLLEGDIKTAAIMCFVFGGITVPAIGGILTIAAGILAILAWDEQRKTVGAPSPPPPAPLTVAASIYCVYCGARTSPEAVFCSSCGKIVKKTEGLSL
jgi:hypothetical protein